MNSTRVVFALLVLALSPRIARANQGDFTFPYATPTGPFTECEMAQVTAEARNHVFVLRQDLLVCLFEPSIYQSFTIVHDEVTSIDVLPGAGKDPSHDAIVATTANDGLVKFQVDGDPPTFEMVVLDNAGWAQSTNVHTANFASTSNQELVGLASDGTTILIKKEPLPGVWVDSSFPAPALVRCIAPMNFTDTFPGQEIALSTDLGLSIYTSDGLQLADYRASGTIEALKDITVLERAPGLTDRIAWCTLLPSGVQSILVVDETGFEPPVPMGNWNVRSCNSGDLDDDGDTDLVLALGSYQHVLWLMNQTLEPTIYEPQQTFIIDPDAYLLLDPGNGNTPSPDNESEILFADVDQDGNGDLIYPLHEDSRIAFMYGPAQQPVSPTGRGLRHTNDTAPDGIFDIVAVNCQEADLTCHVLYDHFGEASEADEWELVVWYTSDYEDGIDPTNPQPRMFAPIMDEVLPGSSVYEITVRFPVTDGGQTGLTEDDPFLMYFYVRPVQRNGQEIVAAGPPVLGAIATSDDALNSVPVHPSWTMKAELEIDYDACPLPEGSGGGSRFGGAYRARLNILENGSLPNHGGGTTPPN